MDIKELRIGQKNEETIGLYADTHFSRRRLIKLTTHSFPSSMGRLVHSFEWNQPRDWGTCAKWITTSNRNFWCWLVSKKTSNIDWFIALKEIPMKCNNDVLVWQRVWRKTKHLKRRLQEKVENEKKDECLWKDVISMDVQKPLRSYYSFINNPTATNDYYWKIFIYPTRQPGTEKTRNEILFDSHFFYL